MLRITLINPTDIDPKDFVSLKYVGMADGTYRFAHVMDEHCQMVNEGEVPISGGVIMVAPDYWKMQSTGSMSLKLPTTAEDEDNLTRILNRRLKPYWE